MLTQQNVKSHLSGIELVQGNFTEQITAYETKGYNSNWESIVSHHLPLAGLQVGGLVEVVQGCGQPQGAQH